MCRRHLTIMVETLRWAAISPVSVDQPLCVFFSINLNCEQLICCYSSDYCTYIVYWTLWKPLNIVKFLANSLTWTFFAWCIYWWIIFGILCNIFLPLFSLYIFFTIFIVLIWNGMVCFDIGSHLNKRTIYSFILSDRLRRCVAPRSVLTGHHMTSSQGS